MRRYLYGTSNFFKAQIGKGGILFAPTGDDERKDILKAYEVERSKYAYRKR